MENSFIKNVLFVDDNQNFLSTLSEELRNTSCPFCVLTAKDGKDALEVLGSTPVDMIVTDLRMPIMDGFELINHMKEKYPDVPIIAMSGFAYPELEKKVIDLGVSRFIPKESINIGALNEIIKATIL